MTVNWTKEILDEAVVMARASLHAGFSKAGSQAARYCDSAPARPPAACPLPPLAETLKESTAPSTERLVRAVEQGFGSLVWYGAPDSVPRELLTRMAAAELIGPDGAIDSRTLRVGLYFMVDGTTVPHHAHSASEYYVVLAGTAEWELGRGWRRYSAGEVVEVPSGVGHAIRTANGSMACLYVWTGDVSFDDYRF